MSHVDGKAEVARIGLSGAVITVAGLTLNDWVALATIIYLTVQTLILLPKAAGIVTSGIRWLKVACRRDKDV